MTSTSIHSICISTVTVLALLILMPLTKIASVVCVAESGGQHDEEVAVATPKSRQLEQWPSHQRQPEQKAATILSDAAVVAEEEEDDADEYEAGSPSRRHTRPLLLTGSIRSFNGI